MDIQKLLNRAPSLPEYEAAYQAYQLETIQGSGERFTVLIAAKSKTEYRVIQTISAKTLHCIFLDKAVNFQGFINLLQEDIESNLSKGKELSDWVPSLSGVTKSPIHKTRSASGIEGVLFQAITSYASLNQGDIVTRNMNDIFEREENDTSQVGRIITNVKSIIEQRAKHLSSNFQKQVTVSNGSSISMDYVGILYNAGFSNFNVQNTKQAHTLAKAKLYDLENLKKDRDRLQTDQSFELLTYLPSGAKDEAKRLFEDLEKSADKKYLRVRSLATFEDFAETIIQAEQKTA